MSAQRFTPEQRRVIDTWGQGIAVLAGAGSGKTTTLVEKCRTLLERDPRARFAAVSFTERSAQDLERKLGLAGCLETESGANWVTTIHGLCGAIVREFSREAGLEGGERVLSEQESRLLWERALEDVWSENAPAEVQAALQTLWEREGRLGVEKLLARVREIEGLGALSRLENDAASGGLPDLKALACIARFAIDRYARFKARQGGLDFSDLERFALQALSHPTVSAQLRERFALVLGDEFQDTNAVQAQILRAIAREDFSNLVVVGDPKQSIYRFRDADVSLFEEFCRALPTQVALTRNFRSRPGILEFVNRSCEAPFAESGLSYVALEPAREEGSAAALVRLDVSAERGPAELAAWLRSDAGRAVAWDETVLLLRGVRASAGQRWLQGLAAAGIPLAVTSGGGFWRDPRVQELVALLKWGESDANRLSAAIALRAPWMGVADATLDPWLSAAIATRTLPWARLAEVGEDTPGIAIARELSQLKARAWLRPGEVLECVLRGAQAREGELAEGPVAEVSGAALGLWHRVEAWSAQGLSYSRVLRELERAIEEERREADVPPPSEAGAGVLRVMTIHGSKGLEFQRVIVVDLGAKGRSSEMPLLFWDRTRGIFLGDRDESGARLSKDPLEKTWRQWEQAQELAESKRVYYVALTRAQEQLVLVCPDLEERPATPWREWVDAVLPQGEVAPVRGENLPLPRPTKMPLNPRPAPALPEPLLDSSLPGQLSLFALPAPEASVAPEPPRASQSSLRRPRHSVTEWLTLSRCARAYSARFFEIPDDGSGFSGWDSLRASENLSSSSGKGGADAADLGTRVHAALEGEDLLAVTDALESLEQEYGSRRLRAAPIAAWVREHEARTLPGTEVYPELAFELRVGSAHPPEILVGSIDRLERSPGIIRILDYKVTSAQRPAADLAPTYGVQLELYAWAAARLLPEDRDARIEAAIVEITARGVREIPIALPARPALEARVQQLLTESQAVLREQMPLQTRASPGAHCGNCPVRARCPDAPRSQRARRHAPTPVQSDRELTL